MLGWSTREAERSIALTDEALNEARTLGDPWWIAEALQFQAANYVRKDDAQAQALMEASLPLLRRIGDAWSIGWNLAELGEVVYRRGQYDRAAELFEESLVLLSSIKQSAGIAASLRGLGKIAYDHGDYARAAGLLDDALPGFRMQGNRVQVADILCSRSRVALAQRNTELAASLLEESLALCVAVDDTAGKAQALHLLGQVARQQGDIAHANMRLTESLRLRQSRAPYDILESIEGLGGLAVAAQHSPESRPLAALRAARLLSAAAAIRDLLKLPLPPGDRAAYERDVAAARGQVDETAWAMAWAEGQAMTLEQAITEALAEA
jgi:tetratricopeptide (TPR) repeat protein